MQSLRTLFHEHRRLAVLIAVLALLVKAVVPGGYMVASQGKVLMVTICADASGEKQMRAIALPGGDKPANQHSGKAEAACPYAGLGMAALASGDLLLLAMAIAFALALGLAPERPMPRPRPRRLRPPLRGPPMLPTV